jgi:hypothetical protein
MAITKKSLVDNKTTKKPTGKKAGSKATKIASSKLATAYARY